MKISVVIPTYKPQEYIAQCLASLGQQTFDKNLFEIIIVLNGCGEPWLKQINELSCKYLQNHFVNIIQTDLAGVSNARNMALDASQGEYIAFIDDDDYISPRYLEELLNNSSPDCVALSDSVYFDDNTGGRNTDNAHHRAFIRNCTIENPTLFSMRVFFNGPCMKLLHRDIIGGRRFDIRFANGEDNLMMFCISDAVKKLKLTSSDAIYYRRIRRNSATTCARSQKERIVNSLNILRQYMKYLARNPFGYDAAFVASRFAAEIKSTFKHK